MTTPSRADRSKTIYEILFGRNPDITRIPSYGAFTCIHKEYRDLEDQSFGLTNIQGVFIGIAHHRKTLGYCITDGTRVLYTRHHIALESYLYPFKLNATAPPACQTFSQSHNSETTDRHQGLRRPADDYRPATQGGAPGQLRRIRLRSRNISSISHS